MTATLARKSKSGQMSTKHLQQKYQELEIDWQNFIQIQFNDRILNQSRILAQTMGLRGADSIHLGSLLVLQQHLPKETKLVLVASQRSL